MLVNMVRRDARRLFSPSAALVLALTLVPGRARAEGASARFAFDKADQALNAGDGYKTATNETGTLGWGESYVMMGYAAMFRQSGDPTYLVKLADHAASVMKSTDQARGINDYAGRSRPCWQSTKYSSGSEPYCWAVHAGMLLLPMAELAELVAAHPEYAGLDVPGQGKLGDVTAALVPQLEQAVAVFDADWKSGPAAGEGHYVAESGATFTGYGGQALPLNMMNALGRAQLALWQVTQNDAYKQRAQALGTYLKNRLSVNGTSYAWTYRGVAWTGTNGEDISHAAINVDFAVRLREASLVFTDADLKRFASTLFDKVHVDSATTADLVDGTGGTNKYTPIAALWLGLSPYDARVWPVGANLYIASTASNGSVLLARALISEHAPPVRDYSFYVVDWADHGTYEKATAFGANVLIDPPDPSTPVVTKLGYRAWKRTAVQQWDGTKYHDVVRLATSSASLGEAFVPFVPDLYFAYSGTKTLFQFNDSFVAANAIEVTKPTPVVAPTITTGSLPSAWVDTAYQTSVTASGDAPLEWRLLTPPAGMRIDAASGTITWTPTAASASATSVTVRVDNDTGHAEKTFNLEVRSDASDGGGGASSGAGGGGASADAGGGGASADAGGGGASSGAGGGQSQLGAPASGSDSGCGCRLPGPAAPAGQGLLFALTALGCALLRDRRG